ncbi:hypothetical protein BVC80_8497g3 [Macleaya cordata]|uniref:Uncharacterized protein n=1 Tax=Macleaya cordata TaxID=56857 RepID=A0A200QY06_MACCD|nr:hypothetical protein BVC80_8497g3 [Macleaya cordata]
MVMPKDVESLLLQWHFKPLSDRATIMMEVLPAAILWSIWLERNQRAFADKELEMGRMLVNIKTLAFRWVSLLELFKGVHLDVIIGRWENFIFQPP